MEDVITDRELMAIATVFLTLHPASLRKEQTAKRERKALIRSMNKVLATAQNTMDKVHYLKVVHEASDVRVRAYDKMSLECVDKGKLNAVSPSGLIDGFNRKDPSLLRRLNVSEKHLESMRKIYSQSGLGFVSMMYSNRLISEMEVGLENIKHVDDDAIIAASKELVAKHGKPRR